MHPLVRLSPHYYNTEAELDRAAEAIAGSRAPATEMSVDPVAGSALCADSHQAGAASSACRARRAASGAPARSSSLQSSLTS